LLVEEGSLQGFKGAGHTESGVPLLHTRELAIASNDSVLQERRCWTMHKPLALTVIGSALLLAAAGVNGFGSQSDARRRDLQDGGFEEDDVGYLPEIRPFSGGISMPNQVLEEVQDSLREAAEGKRKAEDLEKQAQGLKQQADELSKSAEELDQKAADDVDAALKAVAEADALRAEALDELRQAKGWHHKALEARQAAKAGVSLATGNVDVAAGNVDGTHIEFTQPSQVRELQPDRVCVDLPGVQLSGSAPRSFGEGQRKALLDTPQRCTHWCWNHQECKQAVFDGSASAAERCKLFDIANDQPVDFNDASNSSYCGIKGQQDQLMDMLHNAYKAKPWVPEVKSCSWVTENCASTRCCANACIPGSDANGEETCTWYTCYQKDEESAECITGLPPADWLGTKIGGHEEREVPKADVGVLTQRTSLFCFSVSLPAVESDIALASNAKERGFGIAECDAHKFIEALNSGSPLDSVVYAWRQVQAEGEWKQHDWMVKVDPDTVFLPSRLRSHLQGLQTPRGSRVYVRNTDGHLAFDSLQVMSREAVALYFEHGDRCLGPLGLEGGPGYWMLACLEGIGVDFQSDLKMLSADSNAPEICNDDSVVAFPGFRSADNWNACYQTAQESWQPVQVKK